MTGQTSFLCILCSDAELDVRVGKIFAIRQLTNGRKLF